MAVMKCPDCGGKVSASVNTCPHCGRPVLKEDLGRSRQHEQLRTIFVGVALVVGLWYVVSGGCEDSASPTQTASVATYLSQADREAIDSALRGIGYGGAYEAELTDGGWVGVTLQMERAPIDAEQLGKRAVVAIRNELYTQGFDRFRVTIHGPSPGPGLVNIFGSARFIEGSSVDWDGY